MGIMVSSLLWVMQDLYINRSFGSYLGPYMGEHRVRVWWLLGFGFGARSRKGATPLSHINPVATQNSTFGFRV